MCCRESVIKTGRRLPTTWHKIKLRQEDYLGKWKRPDERNGTHEQSRKRKFSRYKNQRGEKRRSRKYNGGMAEGKCGGSYLKIGQLLEADAERWDDAVMVVSYFVEVALCEGIRENKNR